MAPAEVALRVRQAVDPAYWAALVPGLRVDRTDAADAASPPALVLEEADLQSALRRFAREGYVILPPQIEAAELDGVRLALSALAEAGWPAVFVYVFDEAWSLTRHPAVVALVEAILGPGALQTADYWSHVVARQRGAAGWPPHQDYPEGSPRVTVWIPLTDVGPDNGCMYVVPRDYLPAGVAAALYSGEPIAARDARALLQAAQALPAAAGSVLAWDEQLLHWGGHHTGRGGPRQALALAFIAVGDKPAAGETPLLKTSAAPPFALRLQGIATQILNHRRFEMRLEPYLPLATALLAATKDLESP